MKVESAGSLTPMVDRWWGSGVGDVDAGGFDGVLVSGPDGTVASNGISNPDIGGGSGSGGQVTETPLGWLTGPMVLSCPPLAAIVPVAQQDRASVS